MYSLGLVMLYKHKTKSACSGTNTSLVPDVLSLMEGSKRSALWPLVVHGGYEKRKTNLRAWDVFQTLPVRVTCTLPGAVAIASIVSCSFSLHHRGPPVHA
jgi:hypothetical protein